LSNEHGLLCAGSDVVNWLFTKVQGFTEKREAKKYASQMLKTGFIKHTVNKVFGPCIRQFM
jgi:hypothetical protein